MFCNLCASVPQHIRTDKQHEHLQQVGVTERISQNAKKKPIWVTRFRCELCGTEWRHEDDPRNHVAGWSLEKAPTSNEQPR